MSERRRVTVCPVEELPPGERVIVEVDGLSIGVFNVDDEFYALANVCPHHLAPLCEGTVTGESVSGDVGEYEMIRHGEIIQCPWHGWKFDIETGESVFNPHELRTRTFDVGVEPAASGETGDENSCEDCAAAPDAAAKDETELMGDRPPIETYDVDVEHKTVVLYL